jgi:hypothetical protein
MLYEFTNRE